MLRRGVKNEDFKNVLNLNDYLFKTADTVIGQHA